MTVEWLVEPDAEFENPVAPIIEIATVQCLCGGFLTADRNNFASLAWAVEGHRATVRHQSWSAMVPWDEPINPLLWADSGTSRKPTRRPAA